MGNSELKERLIREAQEPGTFWMELSDFVQCFNRLQTCQSGRCTETDLTRSSFQFKLTPRTSGGCLNFPSFFRNSMLRIVMVADSDPMEIAVTASQPDAR